MNTFSTDEILKRLRKLVGVESNKELAKEINVNEKTLAGWKSRNSFPIDALISLSEKFDVSLDWLIMGSSKEPQLDTSQRMLLTAFDELGDAQKMQAVVFVGNLAKGNGSGISQNVVGVGNVVAGGNVGK